MNNKLANNNIPAAEKTYLNPIKETRDEYINGPSMFPSIVELDAIPISPLFLSSGIFLFIIE